MFKVATFSFRIISLVIIDKAKVVMTTVVKNMFGFQRCMFKFHVTPSCQRPDVPRLSAVLPYGRRVLLHGMLEVSDLEPKLQMDLK